MAALNLALRFALELAGVAALAWWGWSASANTVARLALAVLAPAVLVLVWAFVVAPKATNPIPADLRVLIGSALLLGAAAALALAGRPELAIGFAALVVLNTVLIFVLGRPEA